MIKEMTKEQKELIDLVDSNVSFIYMISKIENVDLNFNFPNTTPFIFYLYGKLPSSPQRKLLKAIIENKDKLKVDLEIKSHYGDDLIMCAIGDRGVDMVKMLLDAGVDISYKRGNGRGRTMPDCPATPLMYAKWVAKDSGNDPKSLLILELLKQKGESK
jgi:hypothetical protein